MSRTVHELTAMAEAYGDACKHIVLESPDDAFIYCEAMREHYAQLRDERSEEEQNAEIDAFDAALGEERR